ncbi:hypothetical protein EMCRGX_G033604 [Ephydatia muelleri]
MGLSGDTLKTVSVHVFGLLLFSYLCKDVYDQGIAQAIRCTGEGDNATCQRRVVADLVPKSFLLLEIGPSLKLIGASLALLYSAYVIVRVYRFLFSPVDLIHSANKSKDLGFQVPPGKGRKELSSLVQRLRKVGNIPPPYPNGWYEVMRSCDLPKKAVKAVSMIGQNFAVFRGEDGKACIVDAYCPHLGANLGVGGRVHGNCIECPFHGWQFDGQTGQCTSIPYAEKIPAFAKTKVWPSTECHELIYVWYDAEGRDPKYELEEIEELKTGQWTYRGRVVHYIAAHIEEISENGADVAHLTALHQPGIIGGGGLDFAETWLSKLHSHNWTATWKSKTESLSHIGHMTLHLANSFLGFKLQFLDVHVNSDQIGPSVVILRFKTILGRGAWLQTVVPEEPLNQRMTNYIFADWWIPTFIAATMLKGMGTQIDRDVNVWGNKTYLSKPLLVKEDRLILEHR